MIRDAARCPFCGVVAAGLDADRPELVMAPDRANGRVCEHLAFVSVGLGAYRAGEDGLVPERSGQWLWVRGEGLRTLGVGPAGPLAECVDAIACELLPDDMRLATPYRITGGTAMEREDARSGSGAFPLTGSRGRRLT